MKAINKRRCQNLGFYLVVTLMVLYCVLPFLWQLFTSFKYDRDINLIPPIIPDELTLDHYKNVFAFNNFGYYVRNSIIVSSVTTIVSLIVGAFCAYAMSRLRFKGKGVVMVLTLTASMFPQIAIVSTLYIIFRSLAILNTFYPMMISNMIFTLPLTIWILTSFSGPSPSVWKKLRLSTGLIAGKSCSRCFCLSQRGNIHLRDSGFYRFVERVSFRSHFHQFACSPDHSRRHRFFPADVLSAVGRLGGSDCGCDYSPHHHRFAVPKKDYLRPDCGSGKGITAFNAAARAFFMGETVWQGWNCGI